MLFFSPYLPPEESEGEEINGEYIFSCGYIVPAASWFEFGLNNFNACRPPSYIQ